MQTLCKCLTAAIAAQRNLSMARKADYPTGQEFDTALDELADYLRQGCEPFYKAYSRAMDSPSGELLYEAREHAVIAPVNQTAVVLSKSERDIDNAVTEYVERNPSYTRERALVKVLDERPDLYRAYLQEQAQKIREF